MHLVGQFVGNLKEGREGWASGWDGGMNWCWLREGGHIASGCDGQIDEVGGYSQIKLMFKCNSRLLKLLADLSARWPRPSVMYPSLSSTTTHDPLSALRMTNDVSLASWFIALRSSLVRFGRKVFHPPLPSHVYLPRDHWQLFPHCWYLR